MKKSPLSGFMLALALGAGGLMLSGVQLAFANHLTGNAIISDTDGDAISDAGHFSPGLIVPEMDAALGRKLFATKGCAVCHSVNGIGGEDAPPLDAEYMDAMMSPFEFAARMWRAADAMRAMQRSELGDVIDLTGDELAAITAFVHAPEEQAKYTKDDWSEKVTELVAEAQAEDN